jgi:hypothetical protein
VDYLARMLPVAQQWTFARKVVETPTAHLDHVGSDEREHFGTLEREQAACRKGQIDGATALSFLSARIGAPLQYSYPATAARQQNGKQTTHGPGADNEYIVRGASANRAHLRHTRGTRLKFIHCPLKAPAKRSAAHQASVKVL